VTVPGKLYGVGLGPGDPELVTLKAQRIISSVPVVAYPTARHGRSIARAIAEPYLGHAPQEIAMTFPITVEESDHPGGYEGAIAEHYDRCADEVAAVLESGRDVAALCEGDPFIYGSYIYLHERLAPRFETEVVPGVTSFSAAAALTGRPLVKRDDVLTILPGTLSQDELATRLTTTDGAVVLKLGRRFDDVRAALERAGRGADALYVERVGWPEQRYGVPREIEGAVPYMALVLAPTRSRAPVDPSPTPSAGSLVIVGLGPAGPEWLTPEASATLARADVVVGYETYLARVPVRAGQRRLGSHNRQEIERARSALDLALEGSRVAVVSSGDPGIFAMAAAVLEAAEEGGSRYVGIDLKVVPGLSAMQAASSRVGAPLGHDFCVISLSDQLKPWDVIERRIEAAAAADLVVAFYNPASKTRRAAIDRARIVLLGHRAEATPVVVARAVGSPEEAVTVTSLGELDTAIVDMRTLVIVGSSQTRVTRDAAGRPRVYTPRSYPEA
jgi:precorrin-2 C20-methyltransferase / precorrin-3B C17-methyltransferase